MSENADAAGGPAVADARGRGWAPGDREQVAVVSFSHAIQHCYPAVLGVVYPFALADFGVSYAVLGVVLGVVGLIGGLLQALAGLVRRFPARTLLGSQNLGIAAVSVLGALSPGFAIFATARVLGQLVSWPQHPVGSAHLTDRAPHRRGLVLAAHTTGGNVGTLVAPLLGSAIIAAYSWRWALAVTGALMAAGSLVTWSRVRAAPQPGSPPADGRDTAAASPRAPEAMTTAERMGAARPAPPDVPRDGNATGHDDVQPDDRPAAPGPAAAPVTLWSALRRRKALAVLVAGTLSAAGRGLGVLTTYIPAYLRNALHQPALTIGVLVTVVSLGAIFGPILGGQLSDRMGRRVVLYTLYACGAAGLASFVLVGRGIALLAFAALVVGVFTYSEQPIRQALFSDAMEGVPARAAFGAYFAISQSVGALWITILGFVITDAGFRAAFFVMAASFVAAGAVIAVFTRDRRAAGAA